MKNPLLLALVALLLLLPSLATLRLYLDTPPLPLVVALASAALVGGAVLLLAQPGRATAALAAGFAWGALVAAFFASALNDLAMLWMTDWGGDERAAAVTPVLFAPAIEELAKASALWLLLLLRRPFRLSLGAACGALIGIGFAMTENVQYFLIAVIAGGTAGLGQAVYTRALLGGFNHALFSAWAAVGVAWAANARAPAWRRAGGVAVGLLVAIALHVLWNAIAARAISEILCNPASAGGPCRGAPSAFSLLVRAPLVELAFLAPAAAGLWWVARRLERGLRRSGTD